MKIGDQVLVKNFEISHKTTWASMYIGQIGIIESRCTLYKNSWSVRFPEGDDEWLASFPNKWLEKV